jgi:hypothetical protein
MTIWPSGCGGTWTAANIDKMKGVHKSMQALTPELMASVKVVPYHPGAARAYKEAGLMKEITTSSGRGGNPCPLD